MTRNRTTDVACDRNPFTMDHSAAAEPPYVFGRVPFRADFVQRGSAFAPERSFQRWLDRAMEAAGGELPAYAVRFSIAPRDPRAVALLGVWIASHDVDGSVYPLVFARRLPPPLRELPWPLLFAASVSFLDAAELGLLWARTGDLDDAFASLRALAWPDPAELAELVREAVEALEQETVAAFAQRNFRGRSDAIARFGGLLGRLAEPARDRAPDPGIELPAAGELDLALWLELLRACRGTVAVPQVSLWARAAGRAIVSSEDASPDLLRTLAQPRPPEPHAEVADVPLLPHGSIAALAKRIGGAMLPLDAFASMPPPLSSQR